MGTLAYVRVLLKHYWVCRNYSTCPPFRVFGLYYPLQRNFVKKAIDCQ